MAETPTSALALTKTKLQSAVAASAAFQAQLGVASAAEALPKVFLSIETAKDDRETAALRPYAVVATHIEIAYLKSEGGVQNFLRPDGGLLVYLTDRDRWPENLRDSVVNWDNFLGGVMEDLAAIAGLSDNLAITELRLEAYWHSPLDRQRSQAPFWAAIVGVDWES